MKTYIWFFAILSNSTQVKKNADKEKFALKVSQRGSNNKYNSVKISIIQKKLISLPLHCLVTLGKHFSRHSVALIVHSMQWVWWSHDVMHARHTPVQRSRQWLEGGSNFKLLHSVADDSTIAKRTALVTNFIA